MLRASSEATRRPLDLAAVSDSTIDPLVVGGPELLRFTDACVANRGDLDQARRELVVALGREGASAAARTAGNFEMMNRLLDATGVPVPVRMGEISVDLGMPLFTGRPGTS